MRMSLYSAMEDLVGLPQVLWVPSGSYATTLDGVSQKAETVEKIRGMVAFDTENQADGDPAVLNGWHQTFRFMAPRVRFTTYDYPCAVGTLNRDQFNACYGFNSGFVTSQITMFKSMIKTWVTQRRPTFDVLDCYCPDVYMLGPTVVDRDLDYISAMGKHLRSISPTKQIIWWSWGAYHEHWNGPHAIIPSGVQQRMYDRMKAAGDGILFWGPYQDNEAWIQLCRSQKQA